MKKCVDILYHFHYIHCMDRNIREKVRDCIESNNLRGKTLGEIAKLNDIKIYVMDLNDLGEDGKEISGIIRFSKTDGYAVMINEKHNDNRKRFTLAHELGHFFLHKGILEKEYKGENKANYITDPEHVILYRVTTSKDQNDIIEQEANAFAVELLMEENLVRKAWQKTNNPDKMAELFGVSLIAMSYRLSNLGLVD